MVDLNISIHISDINGFAPPDFAFDFVHNRTANVTGLKGHNNGLDLTNEHLVNNFKSETVEMLIS
jgi:hypothetical protein